MEVLVVGTRLNEKAISKLASEAPFLIELAKLLSADLSKQVRILKHGILSVQGRCNSAFNA